MVLVSKQNIENTTEKVRSIKSQIFRYQKNRWATLWSSLPMDGPKSFSQRGIANLSHVNDI